MTPGPSNSQVLITVESANLEVNIVSIVILMCYLEKMESLIIKARQNLDLVMVREQDLVRNSELSENAFYLQNLSTWSSSCNYSS